MDEDFEARAKARRERGFTGGVVNSHRELEERDFEFWLAVEPAQRVGAIRVLLEEVRILRNDEPFRRLQGSPGGIRSLKG